MSFSFYLCWLVMTELEEASARRASNPLPSLCPHQVSTSAQLRMKPLDSWEAWILCQTFSEPLGRPWIQGIKKKTQPSIAHICMSQTWTTELSIVGLHFTAMYRNIHLHNVVFHYFIHILAQMSCSIALRRKHTYTKWVTHHKHIRLGKSLLTM